MERYDYKKAVKNDIREYLEDKGVGYVDPMGDKRQELEDEMFISDSVTGNASGSYTLNAWIAEENLCHNTELLKEAIENFCGELKDAESNDVLIRCSLLNQCLTEVLNEWNDDWLREHPEDDESEDEEEEEEEDGGEEE
jgi:hypothetical protein